ncbi:helix-turn-helix transcriptional regulator [Methylosinus sp. PW1]|uniref:helix-turn-helix transcriptional regulator n=1 Tax=Methylosinus sp. PW1 TaxID=107636 RepID=UPI00352473BC
METHVNGEILFLTRRQAADYLRLSIATLARWASQGIGPVYYKHAGRTRYLRSDLDAYLAECRRG